MKLTKKILAFLMAGVLAVGILTACSGSAGPLTKDTVKDYIMDIGQATGYHFEEDKDLTNAAQQILTYVNEKASDSQYANMDVPKIFRSVVRKNTQAMESIVKAEDGYMYTASCVMIETYRTDWFNQGQTAVVAGGLLANQVGICDSNDSDSEGTGDFVGLAEGTIKDQKCMVAVFKLRNDNTRDGSVDNSIGGSSSSSASSSASSEDTAASSAAASNATASME